MPPSPEVPLPTRRQVLTGAGAGAVLAAVALCRGTAPVGAILRRPRLQDGTTLIAATAGPTGHVGIVRDSSGRAALRRLEQAGDVLQPGELVGPALPVDVTPVTLLARDDGLYVGGARREVVGEVPTVAPGAVSEGLPEDTTLDDLFARLEQDEPAELTEVVTTDRAVVLRDERGGSGDEFEEVELPEGAGLALWSVVEALSSAPGRRGVQVLASHAAEADAPYSTDVVVFTLRNGRVVGPSRRLTDLGESGPNHLVERADGLAELILNDINGTYRRLLGTGADPGFQDLGTDHPGRVTSAFTHGLVVEHPLEGGAMWESGTGAPAPGVLDEAEATAEEENGTPATPPLLPVTGLPDAAVAALDGHFVLVDV